MNNRLDLNLGVSQVAFDVLRVLIGDYVFSSLDEHTLMSTSAWYNGRERGICLTISDYDTRGKRNLLVVFGECRGTDKIFVDSWVVRDKVFINPPMIDDYTEKTYAERVTFLKVPEAADRISRIVNGFLKK